MQMAFKNSPENLCPKFVLHYSNYHEAINIKVWWLHATLFYILFFLSYDTVQNIQVHTIQFYMMRLAFMRETGGLYSCDEALGQAGLCVELMVFKVTVSSGIFGLPPQLGLEPVPHTSKALAEWYLNSRQHILGN